jgi:type IV pilus assembly protein PilM
MAKKKVKKFKESIGLDIGNHSIKMVHLKKQHHGFKLLNYEARSTIPEGHESSLSDLSPDRFAPILSGMLKSMKINPKKVKHLVSSIGGDETSIKQIKTIFLPDEELESALFFEAKKHLPIGGAEMLLDFQVVNVEEKTNNMNVLLAATTKTMLKQHSAILRNAGLEAGFVDMESLAVANSFFLNNALDDGVYILLNIGAYKTNMVICGPQAKFFARDISYGGFHISKDIAKKNKISFEEAEKKKLEHGLAEIEKEVQGSSLLTLDISDKTPAEQIAMEVKRSLRFYVKEASTSDFRKVVLMGGAAKTKGLAEYINEQLNIPTEVFNPFASIETSGNSSDVTDPQFSIAVGLAMRSE